MGQNPYIPNLAGVAHPLVERAIRNLYTQVNQLSSKHETLATTVAAPPVTSKAPPPITGPLGPTGNAPFPQTPQIPVLQDIPPNGSPYNSPGTFVLVNKVPYIYFENSWVTFPPP